MTSADISAEIASSIRGFVAAVWQQYITRYFTVSVSDYAKLRMAIWYGFMESGKTYSDAVLEEKLKRRTPNRLYIVSNNLVYTLYEIMNNSDILRGVDYIDILFDDALILAHSMERRAVKVYTDKVLSTVRHIVSRIAGRQRIVVALRVATQKFTVLNPVIRNSPVIFLKSSPNDPGDVSALTRLMKNVAGRKIVLQLLRDLTAASYIDDAYKRYAVAVVAGRAKLVVFDGLPAKPDIHHRQTQINTEEFEEVAKQLLSLL
ncbi:MAG: hypothetical protein QXI84_10500 [Thermofilaceae archaeon]